MSNEENRRHTEKQTSDYQISDCTLEGVPSRHQKAAWNFSVAFYCLENCRGEQDRFEN